MAEVLQKRVPVRELAWAILGRGAQKQIERGVRCTPAQAHHLLYHDQGATWLRLKVVDFLERRLSDALARLERAEDDLKQIRYSRMVDRAASRRAKANRQADSSGPGLGARPASSLVKFRV